jgi:hypothetical protein
MENDEEVILEGSYRDLRCQVLPISKEDRFRWGSDVGSIKVWTWEMAPEFLKQYSAHGGDEDGIAWIPNQFLERSNSGVIPLYVTPYLFENLWRYDETPDRIQFRDGLLIIWGH